MKKAKVVKKANRNAGGPGKKIKPEALKPSVIIAPEPKPDDVKSITVAYIIMAVVVLIIIGSYLMTG